MKHHLLGSVVRSFGPNIRIGLVLIFLSGIFSWISFLVANEFHGTIAWFFFCFIVVSSVLLIIRHVVFRVWVHESGIVYREIYGRGEIYWRDLEKIHTGASEIHAYHFSLGTFYQLKLKTRKGEKLSIGERLHGTDDLTELVQSYTLPEMVRKAIHQFENNVQLDFERIRLHRRRGVQYRKWFAWHEIRWEDLTVYGVSDTHVNLGGARKLFEVNIASEKVANVHVLEEILDQVRKKRLSVGT